MDRSVRITRKLSRSPCNYSRYRSFLMTYSLSHNVKFPYIGPRNELTRSGFCGVFHISWKGCIVFQCYQLQNHMTHMFHIFPLQAIVIVTIHPLARGQLIIYSILLGSNKSNLVNSENRIASDRTNSRQDNNRLICISLYAYVLHRGRCHYALSLLKFTILIIALQ